LKGHAVLHHIRDSIDGQDVEGGPDLVKPDGLPLVFAFLDAHNAARPLDFLAVDRLEHAEMHLIADFRVIADEPHLLQGVLEGLVGLGQHLFLARPADHATENEPVPVNYRDELVGAAGLIHRELICTRSPSGE